jgi:hypothetical protein
MCIDFMQYRMRASGLVTLDFPFKIHALIEHIEKWQLAFEDMFSCGDTRKPVAVAYFWELDLTTGTWRLFHLKNVADELLGIAMLSKHLEIRVLSSSLSSGVLLKNIAMPL